MPTPFTTAALALISFLSPKPPDPPPPCPLQFDEDRWDFGVIPDTEPVTHVFKFTNISRNVVKIQREMGCGAFTKPEYSKYSFAPGEKGEITITFNPQGRTGRNPKTITVVFDQWATPQPSCTTMQIFTDAYVQPRISIEPNKVHFPELRWRREIPTTIVTITGRQPLFTVQSVTANNLEHTAHLAMTYPELVDGTLAFRTLLAIQPAAHLPIGNHQTQFTITTNDEKFPEKQLWVTSAVVGDTRANPQSLMVRTMTPSTLFQTEFLLDSRSGAPFDVTSLGVEGPDEMNLAVDFFPTEVNGRPAHRVLLTGLTPSKPGQANGAVNIKTSADGGEQLDVKFFVIVRTEGTRLPSRGETRP